MAPAASGSESSEYAGMSKEDLMSLLDERHQFLIGIVATETGLTAENIQEQICTPEQMECLQSFMAARGSHQVLFFYQNMEKSTSRPVSGSRPTTKVQKTISVTDGKDKAFRGKCIYFIRQGTKKALDKRTMNKMVTMSCFEDSDNGIVHNLESLIEHVYIPALKSKSDNGWGVIKEEKVSTFLESLGRFSHVLHEASDSLNVSVKLRYPNVIDADNFKSPADYVEAGKNAELVDQLEELVSEWCKQIEHVLAESSQMRKEADDIGPKAELEHWKNRTAKFNALTDQIKSRDLQVVISVMHIAKSRLLKQWQELDNRITDAANEAKDNVKYLYTLGRLCEPLYKCNPVELVDAIPGLLNAIKMIYSISRYYNTSERMTSLFVKITNQMITSCKTYIYLDQGKKIWDYERTSLIERLQNCMALNDAYQKCFNRVKTQLAEDPDARQFDFSEMYIFGKFDTFCKRIQRVINILNIIQNFSALGRSDIEDMDVLARQFEASVSNVKRKSYDILDHRKMEFDSDYEEFERSMDGLLVRLQEFIDQAFDNITSLDRSLTLLEKFSFFESLNLSIEDKYTRLLHHFGKEIENVSRMYEKQKSSPPMQRNLPPVAGAVQWARQLYRRIEHPMSVFLRRPNILKTPDAKKIVKKYNKVARVLFEFESLYHKSWLKAIEIAKTGLSASLLIRHPQTKELLVNFDPEVLQLVRETKCLQRVGLEIPSSAQLLCMEEARMKADFDRLQYLVSEYSSVRKSIPRMFFSLFQPIIARVDQSIEPGLNRITWTSLNIEQYLTEVETAISKFTTIMNTATDIRECRIQSSLIAIEQTLLAVVPEEEPWSVVDFANAINDKCKTQGETLSQHNALVEQATLDLIDTFKSNMDARSAEELNEKFADLMTFFAQRTVEAFTRCTRNSLDLIKRRLATTSDKYGGIEAQSSTYSQPPFFCASIKLSVPSVVVYPALEDIQQTLNNATSTVLSVMKGIYMWSQSTGATKKTYYTEISSNKDIVKIMMMFNSAITSMKVGLQPVLTELSMYKDIWEVDERTKLQEFLDKNPERLEFEEEINHYDDRETDLALIDRVYSIGSIELCTDDLKMALSQLIKSHKVALGRELQEIARGKMEEIVNFIGDKQKRLGRDVKDLEDIRLVMDALKDTREDEIRIEMMMSPVEETYQILARLEIPTTKEEMERVDTLRYNWTKLTSQATEVQDHLSKVQTRYREDLLTRITDFSQNLNTFCEEYQKEGPLPFTLDEYGEKVIESLDPRDAIQRLTVYQRRFDDIFRKYETYSAGEELFGLPRTEYTAILETKKELKSLQSLYGLYGQVLDSIAQFNEVLWCDVDIEANAQQLFDYQTKCKKLSKAARAMPASTDLKNKIDNMAETMPILELMADKAMLPRHWTRIEEVVGVKFDVQKTDAFTLKNIMDAPILEHSEDVEDICISATKEKDIEQKLTGIIGDWSAVDFTFSSFKGKEDLLLNGGATVEVVALMEDSLMALSSLLSNRYNVPFKAQIQEWVQKLSKSSEIIDLWLVVQNLFVYLEAVFVGGDIAKDLPQEAKRFQQIDKQWSKLMSRAVEITNVVQVCTSDDTCDQILTYLREQLELCQKSLSGYLETKRGLFPRFYFVSDPTLLEILGQASDSHSIQPHLSNVFDNCKSLDFASDDKGHKDYNKIIGMNTGEGENVQLSTPVLAEGVVEDWLDKLLTEMRVSVNDICRDACQAVWRMGLRDFQDAYPAQVGILGMQLKWTTESEEALSQARSDKKIMALTNKGHLDILNELIEITTLELTKNDRKKYETLVTTMVHNRDVFDVIVGLHIKVLNDFEWLKQSRTYWKEDIDTSIVSITDVDFEYQCELLGIQERLCITPLTDRCYITLAQCMGMSLGGAPAGPAGTGKTETVKDMGRCLGKMVVVFNCSDQMDYRGLGRIFKGMTKSGSWVDFDEFNRIKLPVLSVAAGQIAACLNARRERKTMFIFTDGDNVGMNKEMGVFITMNPGYAGRQELPENLKVQFRTVAMMVPDRQIIMRVKLAAVGFKQNVMLAKKFFNLYKLCEQQLSKQTHYDFGLRNILSVLRTLGAVKRGNPGMTEQLIVMSVLRDMNISKLIDEDEPLFMSLIDDLFPGLSVDGQQYPDLERAMKEHLDDMKLVWHDSWNLKVIQLFETQRVRHGIAVLGPSGAGKTCAINIMMKSLTSLGVPHKDMRMNPKAITAEEMFGRLDVTTNDWTDGIFSTLWRRTHKTKPGEAVWIVLDGPVDTLWIESLNSVLDDNKTLTLANGDRIVMHPTCKMIFEVASLENASPATVSRNGMIFMSSSVLDYKPILQAWVNQLSASHADILTTLFEESFAELLEFVQAKCNAKMELLEANYIRQAIDIYQGLMAAQEEVGITSEFLKSTYAFVIMWSLGSALEAEDRAKLEEQLSQYQEPLFPEIAEGESMYDYLVNQNAEWVHWNTMVPAYAYPAESIPSFNSILVPTVDSVRTEYLISCIAKQRKSVLLIGEQGTAKTVTIQGYLDKFDAEEQTYKILNFSSFTTPGIFQRTVESYVEKRVGMNYGPPGGRKMTLFIDDVNMPYINEWGDQITNEIVRQVVEYNGFYSLDRPGDFVHLADVEYIAAMIHPGGGRNDIPGRLKRHFNVFNCTLPSDVSIDHIFGTIMTGYFTEGRGFAKDICELIKDIPVLTRKLWQATKIKMLPTPSKFHYVFNLRDLSRITEGMLRCTSDGIHNKSHLTCLWKHECTRVVADRFNEMADFKWFENAVQKFGVDNLGEDFRATLEAEQYFVDFLRDAPEIDEDQEDAEEPERPLVYEMVDTLPALEDRLQYWMEQYNTTIKGNKMGLVFFKDAMTHLVKISRIISTPGGHALLVGVGGSGKQSLTRLATYIAGNTAFQITLSRTYGQNDLMEDLKGLYLDAGVKNKGVTFIFTDSEVKDEVFLEYINNILTTGEVPGLMTKEEMDEVRNNLRPEMKKLGLQQSQDGETEFFMSRVRKNLHIVLCFSPVGETFRRRALMFPGLISGCTCDWFLRWPKEALIQVAQQFVENFKIECDDATKTAVVAQMGFTHDDVEETCLNYFQRYRRQTFVTPKSFLSFVNTYKEVYAVKIKEIGQLAERMNQGLSKLIEAASSVAQLQTELVVKEQDLAVASKEADVVLVQVQASAQEAEKVKKVVAVVAKDANELVESIAKDKAIAESELEAAGPALAEAEAALKSIQPAHISTVRKLAKPPHLIMRIMDGVLILNKKAVSKVEQDPERPCVKPSWAEALKMMSSSTFLSSLLNFPKDEMNEEQMELLEPYLAMEDFTIEGAKRVCGDVAGLCSWVKSMYVFYGVNKKVIPLKDGLAIAEHKLEKAQTAYATAQATLDEKQAELDKCQTEFDAAMTKKQALLDDAESCRRKMSMASALISGLSGEKVRWTQQSKAFASQIGRLVGDVLMTCAFLSYCGPFNQEFRTAMLKRWKEQCVINKIPHSDNLDLVALLVHPTVVQEWHIQTLPKDDLSIQNGILVTKASRYPLLVDPQMQGKTWIKAKEGDNGLLITSLKDKYFRIHLEDALSQGKPLLIEDIEEELDPVLYPLLEKNFIRSGRSLKIKLGDKEVDVLETFTLYLTTKLANPRYTPEISAMAAIIDFTVTLKGLEDQLLGLVILNEKNELERELKNLILEVSANNKKMKELEDNLLYRLTSTKGSLVDDESLVDVLATTKTTAEEVGEKLVVAADTEQKINIAREEYRPVATRGSILYFLIVEMSLVNFMYQVALTRFLQLFQASMTQSEKSAIPAKRIDNIIEFLTWKIFAYTVRGLYEQDKFLFTLLLALKIDLQRERVSFAEFNCFIKGGASLDLNAVQKKPASWIPDISWLNLVQLSKLPQFSEILNQVARNERGWKQWYDKDAPEDAQLQDGYQNKLSPFERALLVRAWSNDRTVNASRKYVEHSLGIKYAEGVILNLEVAWKESDTNIPLICFLSLGGDPTSSIESLAKAKKLPIMGLSMGQGQEAPARRAMQSMRAEGGWVLFQNCHLGIEFMEELLIQLLDTEHPPHENFRLWMTTECAAEFPISMLQQCLQYTNEPPNGYRAGLKRTYNWVTQEMLDVSNLPQWKPLLFATSFLHTTVLERRKFGPLGWNIPYEFNHSDLAATIQFLQNHLDDVDPRKGVSWSTVHYMISEVQYGGRVTDDFDQHLLNTYVDLWFGEHMFSEDFRFCKNLPFYVIPDSNGKLDDIRSAIEVLPLADSPEVFGLHPNADITYSSNVAKKALNTIVDIQPKESSAGGSGETREDVVKRQADEFLGKLPDDFDPFDIRSNIKRQGGATPLNVCLRQEIDRIQRVISIVRETLVDLKLAIDGAIIMSSQLADALNCIFDGRVPAVWTNVSWDSSTLGFWFMDLLDRTQQLQTWLFQGRPNCFWLTGFFNATGFLTSLRQTITRAHKGWSLDNVSLTTDVTKFMKEEVQQPPAEGLYIYGLFLEGASWDRRNSRICDSTPKVLFTPLPVVHVSASNQPEKASNSIYKCPVYTKPRRTDLCFIFCIDLRTNVPPSTWTVRGAALLCDVK